MPSDVEFAWAADVVDADGCVTMRPPSGGSFRHPFVVVDSTDLEILQELASLFGGRIVSKSPVTRATDRSGRGGCTVRGTYSPSLGTSCSTCGARRRSAGLGCCLTSIRLLLRGTGATAPTRGSQNTTWRIVSWPSVMAGGPAFARWGAHPDGHYSTGEEAVLIRR